MCWTCLLAYGSHMIAWCSTIAGWTRRLLTLLNWLITKVLITFRPGELLGTRTSLLNRDSVSRHALSLALIETNSYRQCGWCEWTQTHITAQRLLDPEMRYDICIALSTTTIKYHNFQLNGPPSLAQYVVFTRVPSIHPNRWVCFTPYPRTSVNQW